MTKNSSDNAANAADQLEIKQQVRKGLKALNEQERDIILLKDFENFSYREISELLAIPAGTVMSRLFNARKKLAKIIMEFENVTG